MPHSWQDVDSRVRTLESKVDFLMKSVQVQKVSPIADPVTGRPQVRQMNLLDVWREVTTGGGLVGGLAVQSPEAIPQVGEEAPRG